MTRAQEPAELRPGLPPVELRRVWPEWIDEDGDRLHFSGDGAAYDWLSLGEDVFDPASPMWIDVYDLPCKSLAPVGASWSEVETLAAKAAEVR
jgi:hypothetical protein